MASVVEPEPLNETHTEEERAAWEEAREAWERARPIKEAAEGAREAATARAEIREKAARALTRKLPPLFARRNAALAARPIVAANAPWHAAVRTALGRAAHEAVVAKWTPPENFDAEKETDAERQPAPSWDANASSPRSASDGRPRSTRSASCARRGDRGAARRRRTIDGAGDAAHDAIADLADAGADAENHVGETRRREVSARRRRARRRTPPTSSRRRGGRGRGHPDVARRLACARRRAAADDAPASWNDISVHARSGLDARRTLEPWHNAISTPTWRRDAVRGHGGDCANAACGPPPPPSRSRYPRRRWTRGDERVRVVGRQRRKSARAAEYTEAPAARDALDARATAARRAGGAARRRDADATATRRRRRDAASVEAAARAADCVAPKSAGDRDAAAQAQLELGDARAAVGDLTGAMMEWSACLDQTVGVYDAAYTRGSSVGLLEAGVVDSKTARDLETARRIHRGAAAARGWPTERRRRARTRRGATPRSVAASRRRASRPIELRRRRGSAHGRARAHHPAAAAARRRRWRRRFADRRRRGDGTSSTDGTTIAFASSRRRRSRSRAAAFSAPTRVDATPALRRAEKRLRRGAATNRPLAARVELADVATDLGQLAVAADAIASLVYGDFFLEHVAHVAVVGEVLEARRRLRRTRRVRPGSVEVAAVGAVPRGIPRTAPRERASRPRRRVTR